jgi:hypothetical protein
MESLSSLLFEFVRALTLMAAFVSISLGLEWLFSGRFRFSLRSLLIATTIVAVGLGVVVMMLRGS